MNDPVILFRISWDQNRDFYTQVKTIATGYTLDNYRLSELLTVVIHI